MEKKLKKSNTDKRLFGVCGGLAEYFNIDSTMVRLGVTIFTLFYGIGLFAYVASAILMPNE